MRLQYTRRYKNIEKNTTATDSIIWTRNQTDLATRNNTRHDYKNSIQSETRKNGEREKQPSYKIP